MINAHAGTAVSGGFLGGAMWDKPFARFLGRLISDVHLALSIGGGPDMTFGNGGGRKVTALIKDQSTARRLMLESELAFGESYMDGALSIDGDDVQRILGTIDRDHLVTGATGHPRTPDKWPARARVYLIEAMHLSRLAPGRLGP